MGKDVLDAQHPYWEKTFSEKPDMFGIEPSDPARKAAEIFKKEGKAKVLELGSGQGRDTLFLAKNGFQVYALDYSAKGLEAIVEKAQELGLQEFINVTAALVFPPYRRFEFPSRDEKLGLRA